MATRSRLSPAGVSVLEHCVRYRVSTNASIQTDVLPHISLNAVTKLTASLVEQRQLNCYLHRTPHQYFTLGARAVRYFGLSRRRLQPLGPQALPVQFGALYYCIHSAERHQRLLPHEIRQFYPWMPQSQLDYPFYLDIDAQGVERLALIRTDTGASADYLARRCEHDLANRRQLAPEFGRLIDTGRFLVAFVVPTPEKSRALSASLAARVWAVKFRLAICPKLLPLLARLPHGA